MKFNPRSRLVLGGTVAVALLAVLVYLISLPKGQKTIIVASGVEGLTFGRLGEQLVWSLSEIQGNPLNIPSPKETAGSSDNLQALLNSDETIGFVSSATLQQEMSVDPEIGDRVRVLATLYQDQLQLVVRTNIDNIRQLAGKGVYMGKAGSTTETVSANILSNFDIRYKKEDEDTADAAFFLAGTPADHIVEALKDGSRKLLDFGEDVAQIKLATGLSESSIRPFTYQNQSKTIRTVQDDIYLLSNSSFPDDLAYMVVKVMFDDVDRLQIAQHIRLQKVLLSENLPPNIRLHPGVEEFKHDERKTLYIAAAGINDKYWDYGITLRKMLGQRGIQSRVIPTDGSLENLNILESGEQPAIALVQYDTALAAHTGDPQYIYDLPGHTNRPTQITVSGMRRIATLHKEKLHIMYRSDQKGQSTNARFLESENWPSLSVCTGPIESGTRMVAESVLRLSDFEPGTTTELPVNLMVERIFDGSIDVGFYMGNVPNAAIKTLLGSGTANLLNVESLAIAQLGGQVFSQQFIDDPIYRNTRTISGGGGAIHQPVETIGTRAVLVTTADLPFDVTKITRCIFEGADTLGLTTNEMAMDLAIPLHSDALSHYREMEYPGYSKPEPLINSLANSWWNPFYGLENTLKSWGMRAATSETVARGLAIITATLLGILINFFTKNLILAGLKKAWNHAETKWDAIFIDKKVLNLLSYLAAAVVMYALIAVAMIKNESAYWPERLITSTLLIYMLVIAVMIFNCLINGALAIYRTFPISREVPLRGVVQLLKIAVYGLATTLVVAIVFQKSPIYLLSGLGAMAAIGMLIFKDSILGLVSGLQLSANRMVARGDWIAMPKHRLDGEVLEVSLTTLKVQNFDKSIISVPTHTLTSDAFQNWRGMQESDGRRLKRSIHIDVNTIKNCDEELLDRLSKVKRLSKYTNQKREEISEHNRARGIDSKNLVDGRRLTNIGMFRAYLVFYLKEHSKIQQDMTLLVRQLEPGESGLPIEICAFIREKAWADFEAVQSDIFDHILAIVPQFDLKIFQRPSGGDFTNRGPAQSSTPTPRD